MTKAKLLDSCELRATPAYRLLGVHDETMSAETFYDDADRSKWLLPGNGVVYLQVPDEVGTVMMRLESWSSDPKPPAGSWAGQDEVEVDLPTGELFLQSPAAEYKRAPVVLPHPTSSFRMRWQWVFNPATGPFSSPLKSRPCVLDTPASGYEDALAGEDQYCLVQIWRTFTADRS